MEKVTLRITFIEERQLRVMEDEVRLKQNCRKQGIIETEVLGEVYNSGVCFTSVPLRM